MVQNLACVNTCRLSGGGTPPRWAEVALRSEILRLMNTMKVPLVKQASALLLASAFSLATAWCASTQSTPVGQSVPSGPVSFSFTSPTVPVYDLTGSYQFDHKSWRQAARR